MHTAKYGAHDLIAAAAVAVQDKRAGAAAALNAHRKQLLERLKQQQQQQQVAPAYGTADAGADGEMQQLLDTFQQLCSEYM
jgi:acetyl-CoA carboxylase carboxyltransferase component